MLSTKVSNFVEHVHNVKIRERNSMDPILIGKENE